MHLSRFPLKLVLAIMISLLLASCGATSLYTKHELFVSDPDLAAANIYLIRPFTYRERGMADNPVKVEFNGQVIASVGKGEYTFIRVKPVKVSITTRSMTYFTNKIEPIEITRTSELELLPDETYFLHVKQVNEEFRGVYYVIEQVDLEKAKELAEPLHAVSVPGDRELDKL